VVRSDIANTVRGVVEELPANERQAIELAYFGGYTYRETAALLGEPEGTIKSRIKSALRRMQTNLTSGGVLGVDV
jgi:RNA polymerase sigma-70 factor (ECF subfamily)